MKPWVGPLIGVLVLAAWVTVSFIILSRTGATR